jgi:hypothetical protein
MDPSTRSDAPSAGRNVSALSDNSRQLFSDGHHRLPETDPEAVVSAIQHSIEAVQAGRLKVRSRHPASRREAGAGI